MLNEKRRAEVIDLCRRLVSTPSYSGEEGTAAGLLQDYMEEHFFDEVLTDRYGNVIGKIKGKGEGPRILFDGHMDTVPVGNLQSWHHDPFGAELEDGKIYGRGTSDMKGAVAAFVAAAACFREDFRQNFEGELYVAGVVHEECFEGVAARSISQLVQPDYVIIGEASDLNIKCGQRGRAEILVETFGKPAHSANPEKGINAVYQMCSLVEEIRKLKPEVHPRLGKGILELTDIKSFPYPGASVVPEYCRATFDRRLLTGETRESVLKPIQEIIGRKEKEDDTFHAKVSFSAGREQCYTGEEIQGERFFPGWYYDPEEEYIRRIEAELKNSGFSPKITQYSFCTNGSHYAGEKGIRTIGLGPSQERLAHTADEYIEVEQLLGAAECYYAVMKALLVPV